MFWFSPAQPTPLAVEEDTTIADFVIIDKPLPPEDEPSIEKIYFWSYFFRPWHLLKVALMIIPIAVAAKFLIEWNDVVALYVQFTLLLVQLVFTADKLPGMRLNTQSYLTGPTIPSTLEETRLRTRKFFKGPKRTHYVVLYNINGINGKPMRIRKVLQAGLFDDDLPQDNETRNSLTDLACREGAPFSAFPRAAVWRQHLRYRKWMLYFLPILLISCVMLAYNIYFSYNVEWDPFHHRERITPMYSIFGILYALVLLPLVYKIRRWKRDVSTGGEEVSAIEIPVGTEGTHGPPS